LESISAIARRRKDARDGTTWNPERPLLEGRGADEQLRMIIENDTAPRAGQG
jgi:hypothetical protein